MINYNSEDFAAVIFHKLVAPIPACKQRSYKNHQQDFSPSAKETTLKKMYIKIRGLKQEPLHNFLWLEKFHKNKAACLLNKFFCI